MAMARDGQRADATSWTARPGAAAAIRIATVLVPVLAGIATAVVVSRVFHPHGAAQKVAWAGAVVALPAAVVLVVERVAERFLPLSALLKLGLVFPDAAPSRLSVAMRTWTTRSLQRTIDDARSRGLDPEPVKAAAAVLALISALGDHDHRTRGHSERVRAFTEMLGDELGVDGDERERMRWAGLLHDVGKLKVAPSVLNKAGRPDNAEWAQLQAHPSNGMELAAPLLPWLGDWAGAIGHHHEKWDGSGYPLRLAGEDISLAGRMLAVADSFEVMTAARAYKKPMPVPAAREELVRCAGTHFDADVVRAFLEISVRKLRRVVGLVSWLAALPFVQRVKWVGPVERFGRAAAAVGVASLTSVAMMATGALAVPDDGDRPDEPSGGAQNASAIVLAVLDRDAPEVNRLLATGTDVDVVDDDGRAPLHHAAEVGADEVIDALLDAGATVDADDDSGVTPLMTAAARGRTTSMLRLLDAGADVNATSDDGRAPLNWAILGGSVSAVRVAVDAGADVAHEMARGSTALHQAALGGLDAIVDLLVPNGADVDAEDGDGNTPADLARLRGFDQLADRID